MSGSDKLIINAAVTGTVLYKSDTPCLPTSLTEIVEVALRVREAGASIIHLHARGPDESPSYDGPSTRSWWTAFGRPPT